MRRFFAWWGSLPGRLRFLYAGLGAIFAVSIVLYVLGISSLLFAGGVRSLPSPTATTTVEATSTLTPIGTLKKPTPTLASIPTVKPTVSPTPTHAATATRTPRPTATRTPRPTATRTPRPTATRTPRPTATRTPTVAPTATPVPISADFEAKPMRGKAPLVVQFNDKSEGDIVSRLWTFGDGTTSTEQNPQHTYVNPGEYTVVLTVSGPGGEMDSKTGHITVTP